MMFPTPGNHIPEQPGIFTVQSSRLLCHEAFVIGIIGILVRCRPLPVECDKMSQSDGFHILVIDYVQAQIQQVSVLSRLRLKKSTDIELQPVKDILVNNSIGVNQPGEKRIFPDVSRMLRRAAG